MNIHFDCTMCGKCCHNLKLPLSIAEAQSWLRRGGAVELLCEATPAIAEPSGDDLAAQSVWRRSFPATSNALPVRICVTLVAAFEGACPFLLPDMRCGGYEDRPGVCRIYPAEINPTMTLDPARKACPPEAWAANQPLYVADGAPVDPTTARLIARARSSAVEDVATKLLLCLDLIIDTAALANEGFAIHAPPRAALLAALDAVEPDVVVGAADHAWRIVSNRQATLTMLADAGADAARAESADQSNLSYLGFFPAD